MTILSVDKLAKYYGSRCLFEQASFHLEEKDHVGLVGANGTGKSTLFKLLLGQESCDAGGVVRTNGLTIGSMEQHVPEDERQTANEWILSAFSDLLLMEEQLNEMQQHVEAGNTDDALLMKWQHLQEQYQQEGGLYFRSKARSALLGLGLTEEQIHLPLASLSGGQRSKLGLARLLVSRASLLLLDEPTNHLDITAIEWLEEFLRSYEGAYIVVSHDRYFLDRVTTKTMELEHRKLRLFRGNYSAYLEYKKQNREIEEHHYRQQVKEIERLEDAVTEMRRWNREKSIKRAESKEKVIGKLKDGLEKPESETSTIHFAFHVNQTGPNEVLNVKNLSFGFGEQPLYSNLDFGLRRGERVFLIGPNGCGKTTLLKQLMHQLQGKGNVEYGPGVTVGYYDQTGRQLHHEKTILDEVWDDFSHLDQTTVRSALAAFLFQGDDVFKLVGDCSGGERARIALLKTMLKGSNLLLLDEPTNHLDIGSREALEDALADYDGTLLMVSHDRYFINKLANRVLLLTPDGMGCFEGDYDTYLSQTFSQQPKTESVKLMGAGGRDYKARKQRESELRKLRTVVQKAEQAIEHWETQAADLRCQIADPAIAADYKKVMELTAVLEEAEQKVDKYTEEWAIALERLEAAETD